MLMLVKNEWFKLMKKKSPWILWLILVALTIVATFLLGQITSHLDANDSFSSLTNMTSFLNLIVVIVAASSVAEEFSRGTIKFLLIRPYTRKQILCSKFIVCLLYGLAGTVILYITSLVASNLLLTAESPLAVVRGFHGWSALLTAAITAGSNLLLILLYVTIILLISAVIRSQSLAVGVGVGVLFSSGVVNSLLLAFMQDHHWIKWNLFNLLNIQSTLYEKASTSYSLNLELNFWQMAAGILVYSVIIYFFTQWLFNKRDVSLS